VSISLDKTASLSTVLRAHLSERGLRIVGDAGPLDVVSEQFALHELAEVALDTVHSAPTWPEGEITQEISPALMSNLLALVSAS